MFVATIMNWENMRNVGGHYYKEIGSTHVVLVATTTNWEYMSTVCGHYYKFTTMNWEYTFNNS